MYGMVNAAVRGLVKEKFGDEAWHKIHTAANAPESFVAMESYDDDVTYGLVGAAVDVLGLDAPTILRAFGVYWVSDVATANYAELMTKTGVTFVEFIKNLDHMHQGMRVIFPDYRPPSFRVVDMEPGKVQVDYYSEREGLLPFVEGLFQGLGEHFSVSIAIEHVPDTSHPLPCKRMVVAYSGEA